MRVACVLAGLLAVVIAVGAELPADVRADPRARSVLDAHFIPCSSAGEVAVPLDDALAILKRGDLLAVLQGEYARQLPAGKSPEFVVEASASNAWRYVNRHGQRSEIVELARVPDPEARGVDVVLLVRGERFFGSFRALIHVRVFEGAGGVTRFESGVWAFPESSVPRFLARHLGLVHAYFRSKTAAVTELAVRICDGWSDKSRAAPGSTAQETNTAL
jgi:hypothetical protein